MPGLTPEPPTIDLRVTVFKVADLWQVALAHSDTSDRGEAAPERGVASFNKEELAGLTGNVRAYGTTLSRQLFSDAAIKKRFLDAELIAQREDVPLRFTLNIESSAQELQELRWELLRHPANDSALTTSERILFSRFMVSRDFRPIRLRAQTELRALIAIAAPTGPKFERMRNADKNLAPVNWAAERDRVVAALGTMKYEVLGGPQTPLTLNGLVQALRKEVDVVYLVAHGTFGKTTGTPALLLQDEQGDSDVAKADDLATRVAELQRGPRLVVLASCQSAGDGRRNAHASLAERLADAGVPAVVAMQGDISMATVATMMPVLFQELMKDGRIDRAMAVARGQVRDNPDYWMPVLISRLKDGLLWYRPGFRGVSDATIWKKLIPAVKHGKLVPILGPGLLDTLCGDSFAVARTWSRDYGSPLAYHDWEDLPRISQYVSVTESRFNVVRKLEDQVRRGMIAQHGQPSQPGSNFLEHLQETGDRLRTERSTDVHRQLAALQVSTYLTTNYDPLLERALEANQKTPHQMVSRWRHRRPAVAETKPPRPDPQSPLVFHAFGLYGQDESLVLTEDDYFDYLIGTAALDLVPSVVESVLCDNALLFLGFRLTDWRFRVLFRLLQNLPGRSDPHNDHCHVAVQLDPELQTMADLEGAKRYLRKYFLEEAKIEIFFGSAEDFLTTLRQAMEEESGAVDVPVPQSAPVLEVDELDF